MTKPVYLPVQSFSTSPCGGPGAMHWVKKRSVQKAPYVPADYWHERYYALVNGTYTSDPKPSIGPPVAPGYRYTAFKLDEIGPRTCVLGRGFFDLAQSKGYEFMGNYRQSAINSAIAKFDSKLRDRAEVWTTFHERKQAIQSLEGLTKHLNGLSDVCWKLSLGLISPRKAAAALATSLHQSFRNAKRGASNTANAFRKTDLVILKKRFLAAIARWQRGLKGKIGNAADLFLELQFGWIPTLKDIGATVSILSDPAPSDVVSATSRLYCEGSGYYPRSDYFQTRKWTGTWRVKISAAIAEVNQPLFQLDSLGFTNPALVAWQLVPFSFIVDWFANVSQYLQSWTGILGVKLTNVYTTLYGTAKMQGGWFETLNGKVVRFAKANTEGFYVQRTTSLPKTKFRFKDFNYGPLKAATIWALTVQQLRRFQN